MGLNESVSSGNSEMERGVVLLEYEPAQGVWADLSELLLGLISVAGLSLRHIWIREEFVVEEVGAKKM